jgi:hypothetical protein
MMPPKVPCKVYFPHKDGTNKVLTANSEAELASLLRIGWKIEEFNGDS